MSKGLSECTPLCESFRCTQGRGTLRVRTRGGRKEASCNAFEDTCDGAWCQYSKCEMRRMLDGGKCKGREKPSHVAPEPEREYIEDPTVIPEKYAKKLRGKVGG